jgi:hypothetical protein
MNRLFYLFFLFAGIFFSLDGFAQKDNLITANFQNVSFDEFVQKVEAQTDYHFFYETKQFDSTAITIAVTKAHLASVLDKIFHNTQWHYTIDKNNNVFITQGFTLAAQLPFGFFNGEEDTSAVATNCGAP